MRWESRSRRWWDESGKAIGEGVEVVGVVVDDGGVGEFASGAGFFGVEMDGGFLYGEEVFEGRFCTDDVDHGGVGGKLTFYCRQEVVSLWTRFNAAASRSFIRVVAPPTFRDLLRSQLIIMIRRP